MQRLILVLTGVLLVTSPALAAEGSASEKVVELKVGDEAPDFALPGNKKDDEAPAKLSDFRGQSNVLIAFYPKAFTGGCTKQMCNYRDQAEVLGDQDTQVIAISTDEQAESSRFKTEYKMPFTVLGNPSHEIIKAYGVPIKEDDGNFYARRWLFLVDKEGIIQHINTRYKVGEDWVPTLGKLTQLNQPAAPAARETREKDK